MREADEVERAVGHVGLNALDSRRGGIFARLDIVVVEVGRAVSVSPGSIDGCWGQTNRMSSGRDMVAVRFEGD